MERIRRGLAALRQNPRGGVSMIVAACAGVLLLGLTSSLLYAASLPLARANRKIGRERCSQLSDSFAQVLDGELRRYVTEEAAMPLEGDELRAPEDSGRFYNYVNRVLEDSLYGEYDPTDPDSGFFYQTLGGGDVTADYGELTVRLKKTDLKENFENIIKRQQPPYDSYASFRYAERDAGTDTAEQEQFIRYQFTVDVTARLDDDSSHTSTEYYRKDSFQPVYTWRTAGEIPAWVSDGDTGFQVYWNGTNFYRDSSFTAIMEPRHDERYETTEDPVTHETVTTLAEVWDEEAEISYNYYGADGKMITTYKRYIPVYVERNAPAGSNPAGSDPAGSGEGGGGDETP